MATIEEFFIAEYERMKEENQSLRQQLEEQLAKTTDSKYGVFAEECELDVARVYHPSNYYGLFESNYGKLKNATVGSLKELLTKDTDYYRNRGLISMDQDKALARITISSLEKTRVYYWLARRSEFIRLTNKNEPKNMRGDWILLQDAEPVIEYSRSEVDQHINGRIEQLEEESTSES